MPIKIDLADRPRLLQDAPVNPRFTVVTCDSKMSNLVSLQDPQAKQQVWMSSTRGSTTNSFGLLQQRIFYHLSLPIAEN